MNLKEGQLTFDKLQIKDDFYQGDIEFDWKCLCNKVLFV